MRLVGAISESLDKNKKWILFGAIIYLLPVVYRLLTQNSFVPLLDSTLFLSHRDSQIIPVNLETLGALFIIPGALGAAIGTTFLEVIFERRFTRFERYLARVFGSMTLAIGWISVQFFGFLFFNPIGSWGSSLWSGPDVYARNLLVALIVAPLVPYMIEFVYKKVKK
ncbi:MAG: hypothetical protein HYS80_01040 [Candidatus Aenigmarchaeota archaeon]|nr:hypothetical protein [Candidatus Aenigmarchaeota archaeon]